MSLEQSKFFCAIVDPHFLASPDCLQQVSRAVLLHKPIFLLVMPDTYLPKTLALGAHDLAVYHIERQDDGRPNARAAHVWLTDQMRQREARGDV